MPDPNVIERLVVELALDDSKLAAGRQKSKSEGDKAAASAAKAEKENAAAEKKAAKEKATAEAKAAKEKERAAKEAAAAAAKALKEKERAEKEAAAAAARAAAEAEAKINKAFTSFFNQLGKGGSNGIETFGALTTSALEFAGASVILGVAAKAAWSWTNDATRGLERVALAARGAGVSAQFMSLFAAEAEMAGPGGKAAAENTVATLQAQQERWRTGQGAPSVDALKAMSVIGGITAASNASEIINRFLTWSRGRTGQEVSMRANQLGIDPGVIPLATTSYQKQLEFQQKAFTAQPTQNEFDRSVQFQQELREFDAEFKKLGTDVMIEVVPALTTFVKVLDFFASALVRSSSIFSNWWNGIANSDFGKKIGLGTVTPTDVDSAKRSIFKSAFGTALDGFFPGLGAVSGLESPSSKNSPQATPPSQSQPAVPQKDREAFIYATAVKNGFTTEQARGIVAGFDAESNADPQAFNKSSGAAGIGQWLGGRSKEFARREGVPVQQSSLAQQLDFFLYELSHGEKRAGVALHRASRAVDALQVMVHKYERPAQGWETWSDIARGSWALASTVNIHGLTMHTQADDAKGIARDLSKELAAIQSTRGAQ